LISRTNSLDPFIGSGSTAVAAIKSNRHFVGYDINPEYIRMSEKRIKEARSKKSQAQMNIQLLNRTDPHTRTGFQTSSALRASTALHSIGLRLSK